VWFMHGGDSIVWLICEGSSIMRLMHGWGSLLHVLWLMQSRGLYHAFVNWTPSACLPYPIQGPLGPIIQQLHPFLGQQSIIPASLTPTYLQHSVMALLYVRVATSGPIWHRSCPICSSC
jgi:hypothetical protein